MCGCTNKISRNMRRGKLKLSTKSVQKEIPTIIGGAAALAANPLVEPILGNNSWVAGGVKTIIGLVALSLGNQYATGFGTVMAAYGAGQLINKAAKEFTQKEIPGLPGVNSIPGYRTYDNYQVGNQAGAFSNGIIA